MSDAPEVPDDAVSRADALYPVALGHSKTEPNSFSFADGWTVPSERQFSLLDLMYWMFWLAVLSALLRLMYGHTRISDKWHAVTTCMAASITLAAAWGYSEKIPKLWRCAFRTAVTFAAGLIGLLLCIRLSLTSFSGLELATMSLANAVILLVGYKIGTR